ncbi:hypothetical protein [Salinibacter ruber]|uniref:hypothetical protein n=1 Tax=Salinibacter ruber TaxID=146919 RepID=UPI00216A8EF4|nr:hypothetical protein [Salinibacter ruber]
MCLGNGEAYPQRVAAESFEEDHLNCGRNRDASRRLLLTVLLAKSIVSAREVFLAREVLIVLRAVKFRHM